MRVFEATIMFGNGANIGGISWDDLLLRISTKYNVECTSLIKAKQYTMAYEKIIVSPDASENDVKTELAEELDKAVPSKIYSMLARLNARNYLTTNYELHLVNEFLARGDIKGSENKSNEDIYSMRRYHMIEMKSDDILKIWNIHGSTKIPKSIMLGLDHYCGYTKKIKEYIDGDYMFAEYHDEHDDDEKISKISEKLLSNNEDKIIVTYPYDEISWVELFFRSNVYILGFGLSFNEIDIWWILNKRARMMKDPLCGRYIRNSIVFFCNMEDGEKIPLLKSFGVKVEIIPGSYDEKYYELCIERMITLEEKAQNMV